MSKLKVITIVGTRPEIIRLSRVIPALDRHFHHVLVHTGQNHDYLLNEVFFEDLELRKPDHFLQVDTSSLGTQVADIIRKSEAVLLAEKPDALLVLGDTNSCLSAYMAKRMHIPIFHMEAGNRCFDENVPEETNRRIIDHIADFNLVYTEHARRHLRAEGLPLRRIFLTGSPMKEVLDYYRPKIKNSKILQTLQPLNISTSQPSQPSQPLNISASQPLNISTSQLKNNYFLVSLHREENVDHPEKLKHILHILNLLATTYKLPIIISTHPRTRQRLNQLNPIKPLNPLNPSTPQPSQPLNPSTSQPLNPLNPSTPQPSQPLNPSTSQHLNPSTSQHLNTLQHFHEPFAFTDYIQLQQNARCVISDSGTISEESAILSFPAVTLRQSMERPEALEAGTIILTGFDPDTVLAAVESEIQNTGKRKKVPAGYRINNTSERVVKLIQGLTKLNKKWSGIEK